MKITQKNVDDLTLVVTLGIEPDDYTEKRKKILSDYRRKADLKGFRKGMAPMSLIEKMHGRSALLDAVNSLISDSLNNYITENKLNIIGEPLPNETEQKPIDWEVDTHFEFVFDMALAPKVEFALSAEDTIPYHEVEITDEAKKEYINNTTRQFGSLVNVDQVEEEDFIIADLSQEEMKIEGTYITLRSIAKEEMKAQFLGKKANESFEVNVNETFENESDRAAMLKVKKEELASLNPIFTVTIKEVKRFSPAEINQELFDKMYGEGVVKSQEEFDAKIVDKMSSEYSLESDYKFMLDAREALINKANLTLPEEFLKRWLFSANEGKFSMEEIEKDFDLFLKDFRWQMIKQYIVKEQKLQISREMLLDHARRVASYQFAMYGLNNAPEEQLNQFAESLLTNEKEGRKLYEKVEEDMVINYVKSVVTIDKKPIKLEDLHELTK